MIPTPSGHRRRPRLARPITASLLGAAIAATGLVPLPAHADPGADPIAEYLFTQASGTSVPNSAGGAVGAATVNGSAAPQWTGTSLAFPGGAKSSTTANWVRLPDNLLTGANSATITIETKLDASMKSNWHFLWNIGSEATTQYYFASVKDNPRTSITTNSGGGEVNARSATPLDAERWYSLTSVIDGDAGRISFYVDGVQVASTATSLKPSSITNQTFNTIGRAPYPDPLFKGEVSTFRVFDEALDPGQIAAISDADAGLHAGEHAARAQAVVDSLTDFTIDDAITVLPSKNGQVTWSSDDPDVSIGADGITATVNQPAAGGEPISTMLTATATVRGVSATKALRAIIRPRAAEDDAYGYAMVHFIENSAGYAEKIYLDISRGDDPEHWQPLNGGQPILASHLGTTGIRDPYLTRNPETGVYYIIATDLRVFGGDQGGSGCTTWCHWQKNGSTKLNIWESTDLVTWGPLRQIDVVPPVDGQRPAELGMAWAPEATWVNDYYPDGSGAFIVYWSSTMYPDATHTGSTYSRVLWGATPDFTQDSYSYGGILVDTGANAIDTTIAQHNGTTYRITKDNGLGRGIYMESTTAEKWWLPSTDWILLQTRIGADWANNNAGGVEGPAIFQRHGEDHWYLYVDVIPTTGYRPMHTQNLDDGFTRLISDDFTMPPNTKHGGIVGLARGQYDVIRNADATAVTTADLGSVDVEAHASIDDVRAALPPTAEVTLAYNRGTASLPVDWDLSGLDTSTAGAREITGTVRSIGANLNQWVGAGGSIAWNAPDRRLYSSTALTVSAQATVAAAEPSVALGATTRCVAGKVVLAVSATNETDSALGLTISSSYGSKPVASLAAGATTSAAFSTRQASIPAGSITATVGETTVTASYTGVSCAG